MSYKDRQQSLKLMQAGYAEKQLPEKMNEIKRAQAMQAVQLNEIEQSNPIRLISAGYRVLEELNKPQLAETESTIQLGGNEAVEKDTELQAIENHLGEVGELSAKMDAMLEFIKQKAGEN